MIHSKRFRVLKQKVDRQERLIKELDETVESLLLEIVDYRLGIKELQKQLLKKS